MQCLSSDPPVLAMPLFGVVLIHFGCAFQFVQTKRMVCIDFNCSCQIFIYNFTCSSTFGVCLVFACLVPAFCNRNKCMKQLSNMNDHDIFFVFLLLADAGLAIVTFCFELAMLFAFFVFGCCTLISSLSVSF